MRFPSGVPGFDALIQGGFPSGAAVIVQGPAGREKDAFLLQFVADALRRGAAALVLLASVSPAKYEADLREAGVDVDLAIAEQRLRFVDWFTYKEEAVQDVEAEGPTFRASIDLANVGIAVSRAIAALPREGEKCAAIEILSPALSVYDLPVVYGFAQSTKAKLERFGFTGLFVLEKEMHDERTLSSLHQPFDGVVDIERVREGDSLVRKIAVLSLKGTAAQSKYVPIEVGADRVLRVTTISDRERSLRKQEELIKSNPKDPKLWLATARNLNAMGERERALRCVEAALNLDSHDADAWRLKAEVLEAMGRKDEALNARTRAFAAPVSAVKLEDAAARLLGVVEPRLRLNPRDPDALFVKAAAQAKMDAIAEAIRTLEALADADEAYPGLWVLKAKLHARLGEREKAQESRQRAIEVDKRLAREREAQRPPPPPPEASFECPECGATVGEHDTVCPSCGVLFEVEGAPKPEVPPAPRPPPSPRPRPEVARPGMTNGLVKEKPRGAGRTNGLVNGTRGRTNGLVNGTRGRTNGLVNGTRGAGRTNGLVNGTKGRTNGLVNGTRGRTNGLVNGTRGRTNGLVNGTRGHTNGVTNGLVEGLRSLRSGMTNGLTNGSGFTNGLGSKRYSRESRRNRWKIFLIPLTFVLLVAIPFLSADLGRGGGPQIDGAFDDWAGAPGHAFPAGGPDPNVALDRVEFMNGTDAMFLLVQVQGTQILAGGPTPPGVMNAVYVFVDTDRDAATGYPIRGIGADRLVDIQGHGGTVMSAIAYSASQASPDRRDWRSWTDPAPIAAAASGNRLEMAVDWLLLGDSPRSPVFLVASQGWDDTVDFADSALAVTP
ncbi:MAG TPA: ATPase domain-containing protein, partial [Thermoplasmata archaeon]|nr:ATPase domain-containing protein [Thermoplasmata archaeon]